MEEKEQDFNLYEYDLFLQREFYLDLLYNPEFGSETLSDEDRVLYEKILADIEYDLGI